MTSLYEAAVAEAEESPDGLQGRQRDPKDGVRFRINK